MKTLPRTVVFCVPVPSSSPAAPRWTKALWENSRSRPWLMATLPGILVQDAYGQVPPGVYSHSPWVFQPSAPVTV
ncbi:hypothetical protein [Streptomyces sp. NPDC094472]|uniref:hypothetical protein n=1 Tax=unclassified Streptomyces TaxID=2593676 RepID=UPI00332289D8